MHINITHAAFQKQQLAVIAGGLFSAPRLLLNGAVVAAKNGIYELQNDAGNKAAIKLKRFYPDPVPRMTLDGVVIDIARPLAWYAYAWSLMPVALLVTGGTFGIAGNLLGGIIGVAAAYLNLRIFRGEEVAILKYWASLLVTLGAYIVFAILITLIQAATGKH